MKYYDETISKVESDLAHAERVVDSLREELILLQTQRAIFNLECEEEE